jgi:hypothetical protein
VSKHPINLALRFFLELAGLAAMAYWGWTQHEGILRVLLAVGLPVLAAVLWGVFRVTGYPNKSVVETPGPVRLLLEFAFFGSAVALLFAAGQTTTATIFAVLLVIHYVTSYDYVRDMLTQDYRGANKVE